MLKLSVGFGIISRDCIFLMKVMRKDIRKLIRACCRDGEIVTEKVISSEGYNSDVMQNINISGYS